MSSRSSVSSVPEDYWVVKSLGAGKFAEVKEVKHRNSRQSFAWKQVDRENNPFSEDEARLLTRLKHEHIIQVHQVFMEGDVINMMLELCTGGCMSSYLLSLVEKYPGGDVYVAPNAFEMAGIFQQLLGAVNFLHENYVAHRDIKPDNVLLGKNDKWKLADFNLACEFDPKSHMTEVVGTRNFCAPEVHEEKYTSKCDLYSTGVLFITAAQGECYVRQEGESELLKPRAWRKFGPGALDCAQQMIAEEARRCDAFEALQSPWLLRNASHGGCCVIS